jgi:AcrR family transcriptional regulator
MGHREDLLAGARRCLYEKGYGRTTARDIVAASGTNLASIGYHYGSKDALLNAALFDQLDEAGAALRAALGGQPDPDGSPLDRVQRALGRVLESFTTHQELLAVLFEALTQLDRVPRLHETLADRFQADRAAWTAVLAAGTPPTVDGGADAALDAQTAQAVGSLCQVLAVGLLVQWLVDPQRAPSGGELADALRALSAAA